MDVGLYKRSATLVVLSTEQLRARNKCRVALKMMCRGVMKC